MGYGDSLMAQLVKNLPAMQETPVRFLGREDPLETGIGYPLQSSWASLVALVGKQGSVHPLIPGQNKVRGLTGMDAPFLCFVLCSFVQNLFPYRVGSTFF